MNLRVFKKDVDFLTEDFLSDALISMGFAREESKRENILGIINEAIDLRDETYAKINHPEEGNLKAYYRKTTEDFLKSLDALCEKLGEAIK
ncbi:MAG: hypothetical protein IKW65_07275 [Bacteroidales bacterium]|jgi:hypothetical protein|nr:hypothetical protein [Bacteroidales bacterium]